MQEQWKVIDEDGVAKDTYLISNLGRIKSRTRVYYTGMYHSKRVAKGQFMKPSITAKKYTVDGYYAQPLRKADGSGAKTFFVHRLVAKYFLPDFNENLVVNHKDENSLNNRIDNLEMMTQKENNNYGHHNENVYNTHKQNGFHTGHINTIITKGNETLEFNSIAETARYLGVGRAKVKSAILGQRKTVHGWHIESQDK